MALYVKKFGGSSVATPEKMLNIANRVLRDRKPGDKSLLLFLLWVTARMTY